jgi:DNA polymerase I-like protein with 3'-5' exonuclease and polymerase domains
MDVVVIDYETEAIVGNPVCRPPRAVGVSVWAPGHEPVYLAWGHPMENNCYFGDAHRYIGRIADSGIPMLFHHAAFDISVNDATFCNAKIFPWGKDAWRRIHDTMFLLFLADPYASTYSLKPSADRYLGMAPTEQLALRDWIVANVPEANSKNFGAYISRAPGDLVGDYAIGDVVRTRRLFDLLHARIVEQGMEEAYDRERRLLPKLMSGTRRGIPLARDRLEADEKRYTRALVEADHRLAGLLGCPVDHLEHDETFANALEASGAVTEWVLTPKSKKRSLAVDNLKIARPDVKALHGYRSGISTCLSTFMRPWLEFSKLDGRVHPEWNQVRTRGDARDVGTRTGRMSGSGPNFQNVPTEFVDSLGKPLPVPEGLPDFPIMRRYCLPEDGHLWIKRDFSSQEIRILAHFEDGALCQAYRANPELDPHQMAVEIIQMLVGVTYARKDIKVTGFSLIYGSGVRGIAGKLGVSYGQGQAIRDSYLDAMPGVRTLMQDVQRRGKSGQPIRTWGGRLYYVEAPKEIDGQLRDFAYKLLNYLIQGSAADQTKESINEWWDDRGNASYLAAVHDEINASAPKETWKEDMAKLKKHMNADRFDVPMLSEGFVGENWGDIVEEDKYDQLASSAVV